MSNIATKSKSKLAKAETKAPEIKSKAKAEPKAKKVKATKPTADLTGYSEAALIPGEGVRTGAAPASVGNGR